MFVRLRNYVITGAVVLVPVVLTWYVLAAMFRFLDGLTARWVIRWIGHPVPGLGMLVTVAIVVVTGILTRSFIGHRVITFGQSIIARMPIVRSVYVTIRQIVDAFAMTDQNAFKRVALIEYPRKGIWSIAFLTSSGLPVASEALGQELVSVFLPTTPNPTSGFLLLLPRKDVRLMDISVEDGLKLVISGGVFSPGNPPSHAEGQVGTAAAGTAAIEEEPKQE